MYFSLQTADVAAGPITVTAPRQTAVDFTYPFMASGIQALVLNTQYVSHDPFRAIYPFTIEVWFLSIFIFVLVALMIWAANKFDPYEWKHASKAGKASEDHRKNFTLSNALWFCGSTLFLQSSDHTPRSNAGRCIAAFWYLYVLFMVFLYIVNVQFFITSQTRLNYIKDIADVKAEKTIKYGTTYKGTDTYHVFKVTKSLKSMWHKMNNDHKSPYVKDLKEGVAKVRHSNGRFTLLGQAPILRYIASQKPCDVEVTGAYLHRGQYAFAVAKDSPLGGHISSALEALRDSSVLEDLERDWWDLDDRWGRCRNQTKFERDGAYSLFVQDVNTIYYMLAVGVGISIIVFVVEIIYYKTLDGGENYPSEKKKKTRGKSPSMQPFRHAKDNDTGFNGVNDYGVGGSGGARGGGARGGGDDDPNMWI